MSGVTKLEKLPLAETLGRFLCSLAVKNGPLVQSVVEALVQAEADGHACVRTGSSAETTALLQSGVAGEPGADLPLIIDGERVYLRRMFLSEGAVAQALKLRLVAPSASIHAVEVGDFLKRCGLCSGDGIDWQAVAVVAGLVRPLLVVSGGPGTGKTRTAAVLVAAIQRFQPGSRIALAAPTGKAAARLGESIGATLKQLGVDDAEAPQASTLHRLLGASADGKRFRHNASNPLPADVVLVDEASMVDLALMSRLVEALRPDARLVLLGDKDQLASVEAGYVLGDLCEAAGLNRLSSEFAGLIRSATGIVLTPTAGAFDAAMELRRNHRFAVGSSIQAISGVVRAGDAAGALAMLSEAGDGSVLWRATQTVGAFEQDLTEAFERAIRPRWMAGTPAEALEALGRFQILCAVKAGPFGRDAVNDAMERMLEATGVRRRGQEWYRGRPVMITANAPQLELFNGDLGVAWEDANGVLQTWFSGRDGARPISPARLPTHETAFAMTVHKSQGSEFDEVMLVLPPVDSPVCTRELIYTGITRARRKVTVIASKATVTAAIGRGSARSSGLKERLLKQGSR